MGVKHLTLMKAVSGNFTLSHACSHVGLPQANSLPATAAGRLQDAPSGDAGVKQAAQVDGWVGRGGGVVWLSQGRGGFIVENAA